MKSSRFLLLSLALPIFQLSALAQENEWRAEEFKLDEQVLPAAQFTTDRVQMRFYCDVGSEDNRNLNLSITHEQPLSQSWVAAYENGLFDGRALVQNEAQVVGNGGSMATAEGSELLVSLNSKNYAFDRLVSGSDLSVEFYNVDETAPFQVNVSGANLGTALCPIATQCGHGSEDLCAIFATVEPPATQANALTATKNDEGEPQWFKSEYQTPFTSLPFHRTASIFDPDGGAEIHLSCLAEDGETLAINFLFAGQDPTYGPFDPEDPNPAEIVWQTGDSAGRWTQFRIYNAGFALGREGIVVDMINRATLEELMTTDRNIEVIARQGARQVAASFTPRGSRDAICAVMNGCAVPLGFSPACENRR